MLDIIAPVKMNISPKILFLFQNLQMLTSTRVLNDLDWNIRKLFGKTTTTTKNLQDRKENGGFAHPNFHLYYQASSLTWLKN